MGRKSNAKVQRRAEEIAQRQSRPTTVQQTLFEMRSAPLPDPEELQRYGEVVPGLPEAIVDGYLKQGEHRRMLERRVVTHGIVQAYLGMVLGFVLAAGVIYGAIQVMLAGQETTGAWLIFGTLASLVGTFIYGRKKRDAELERRKDS